MRIIANTATIKRIIFRLVKSSLKKKYPNRAVIKIYIERIGVISMNGPFVNAIRKAYPPRNAGMLIYRPNLIAGKSEREDVFLYF